MGKLGLNITDPETEIPDVLSKLEYMFSKLITELHYHQYETLIQKFYQITKLKKEANYYEILVEKTEQKISAIEKKFEIEDFFVQTSHEEVWKLQNEKNKLNEELSRNIKQWELFTQNLEIVEERLGV